MMAGEILQVDKPGRVYAEPADIRVAEFIGSPKINILPGVGAGGIVTAPAGMVMGRVELVPGTHLRVGIRWRPCEGADFADETCPLDAPPLLRCSKNLAMRRQGAKTIAVPKQSDWLAGCMRTLSRAPGWRWAKCSGRRVAFNEIELTGQHHPGPSLTACPHSL